MVWLAPEHEHRSAGLRGLGASLLRCRDRLASKPRADFGCRPALMRIPGKDASQQCANLGTKIARNSDAASHNVEAEGLIFHSLEAGPQYSLFQYDHSQRPP